MQFMNLSYLYAGAQRNDAKQQGIEWYEGQRAIPSFYDSDITSYDYQAPISEAGDYGQPGSGGPNKFEVRYSTFKMLLASLQVHDWQSEGAGMLNVLHPASLTALRNMGHNFAYLWHLTTTSLTGGNYTCDAMSAHIPPVDALSSCTSKSPPASIPHVI